MINNFKFLSDNKPKIRYTQTVLPAGHVLAPIFRNYDESVIDLVKIRMRTGNTWRGHREDLPEPNPSFLTILGGININGIFQIQYVITRGGVNMTSHITSFPMNEI